MGGPRRLAALRCAQCDEPLCAFSCKSGALHRLPDGAVVLDETRCIDCLMCFMVCPFLTTATGGQGPGVADRPIRCDVCAERERPACADACPTRALRAVTADRALSLIHI